MTDRPDPLRQRLAAIADMGPALRAAGYASVEIDDDRVSLRLAPPYGPIDAPTVAGEAPTTEDPGPELEPDINALEDPSTYEDGKVPGYELDEET